MGKRLITLLTMLLALTTVSAQDYNQIDADGNVTRRENQNNRPPFIRANKQTTRFVKSLFLAWLEERVQEAERTGRSRFV